MGSVLHSVFFVETGFLSRGAIVNLDSSRTKSKAKAKRTLSNRPVIVSLTKRDARGTATALNPLLDVLI